MEFEITCIMQKLHLALLDDILQTLSAANLFRIKVFPRQFWARLRPSSSSSSVFSFPSLSTSMPDIVSVQAERDVDQDHCHVSVILGSEPSSQGNFAVLFMSKPEQHAEAQNALESPR